MKKILATLLLSCFTALTSAAQDITAIVAAPAGSQTDVNARVLLKRYDEVFGTSSIVTNRPGANGQIGILSFIRESNLPHHGMMLLFATHSAVLDADSANLDQLSPVVRTLHNPFVLYVRKNFPADTFTDFVAYAKANPGKVNIGGYVGMMPLHLSIQEKNKYTTTPIIYNGRPEIDVASGVLDGSWHFETAIARTGFEDKVKILASTNCSVTGHLGPKVIYGTDRRIGCYYTLSSVWASAKDSSRDVETMNTRLNAIMHSEWGKTTFTKNGGVIAGGTTEDLLNEATRIRAEWRRYKEKYGDKK